MPPGRRFGAEWRLRPHITILCKPRKELRGIQNIKKRLRLSVGFFSCWLLIRLFVRMWCSAVGLCGGVPGSSFAPSCLLRRGYRPFLPTALSFIHKFLPPASPLPPLAAVSPLALASPPPPLRLCLTSCGLSTYNGICMLYVVFIILVVVASLLIAEEFDRDD